MKVFILALDGLEHDFVVKWKLRNLLQKTYGRVEIGEECFHFVGGVGRPYSPLVWASFITGVPPSTHKITGFWTYNRRVFNVLRNLPFMSKVRGKRRYLSKLGIKPRLQNREHLEVDTLFDVVKPSIAIDVLGYNPIQNLREKQFKSRTLQDFLETAYDNFTIKRQKLFEQLEKEWKVFMHYVSLTDIAGHCMKLTKLRFLYQSMDQLAEQIKEAIGEPCLFLIVSDHGFTEAKVIDELAREKRKEIGAPEGHPINVHSKHAFFSLNISTEWRPTKITDFFQMIIETARLP